MATRDVKQHAAGKWISILNLLLGIWLILAPAVLGYMNIGQAVWNQRVIGSAIVVVSLIRLAVPDRYHGLSWLNFVFGGWLIVAPFVLEYTQRGALRGPGLTFANDLVVGILVLAVAAWSTIASTPR